MNILSTSRSWSSSGFNDLPPQARKRLKKRFQEAIPASKHYSVNGEFKETRATYAERAKEFREELKYKCWEDAEERMLSARRERSRSRPTSSRGDSISDRSRSQDLA